MKHGWIHLSGPLGQVSDEEALRQGRDAAQAAGVRDATVTIERRTSRTVSVRWEEADDEAPTLGLRDTVNTLVDLLDCTRQQATTIVTRARRDGYPDFGRGRATEVQG
jgi:hypothetical protein